MEPVFAPAQERRPPDQVPEALDDLVRRVIPGAVIFADEPEHVADLRRRAAVILAPVLAQASAAPELLAALKGLVEEKADYMRLNHLGDPEAQHTIRAARAAIAKATTQAVPAEAAANQKPASPDLEGGR